MLKLLIAGFAQSEARMGNYLAAAGDRRGVHGNIVDAGRRKKKSLMRAFYWRFCDSE